MPWHEPITWVNDRLVTADDLNNQLRDNLSVLKNPVTALFNADQSADLSTTVYANFVDTDPTNLKLTITTEGGDVMVGFVGTFAASGTPRRVYLNLSMDTSGDVAGEDGIVATDVAETQPISFVYLIRNVAAGSHTFKLRWKTRNGANVSLYMGAGTSGLDLHPQFWAREVS